MTDHADTIRRYVLVHPDNAEPFNAALDALVAERQQAIDERDRYKRAWEGENRDLRKANRRCEQAIDALRDLGEAVDAVCDSDARSDTLEPHARTVLERAWERGRAALLNLGERPDG